MLRLDDPIAVFAVFLLAVVTGAAVRAVWRTRATRHRSRPALVAGLLLLTVSATVGVVIPTIQRVTSRAYPWHLADPGPGVSYTKISPETPAVRKDFDEAAARATTVVRIVMDMWPASCPSIPDWLAEPDIAYTPWSITISMRARPDFDFSTCSGWYDIWGTPLEIQLSQPLDGRPLFDGSGVPTTARPYP